MNDHLHPIFQRTLAAWCLPDGTRPVIQHTYNTAPRSRAEYFDECRAGMDCGHEDDERDDDDDFEGAPV